jgi:hypothetical protein
VHPFDVAAVRSDCSATAAAAAARSTAAAASATSCSSAERVIACCAVVGPAYRSARAAETSTLSPTGSGCCSRSDAGKPERSAWRVGDAYGGAAEVDNDREDGDAALSSGLDGDAVTAAGRSAVWVRPSVPVATERTRAAKGEPYPRDRGLYMSAAPAFCTRTGEFVRNQFAEESIGVCDRLLSREICTRRA